MRVQVVPWGQWKTEGGTRRQGGMKPWFSCSHQEQCGSVSLRCCISISLSWSCTVERETFSLVWVHQCINHLWKQELCLTIQALLVWKINTCFRACRITWMLEGPFCMHQKCQLLLPHRTLYLRSLILYFWRRKRALPEPRGKECWHRGFPGGVSS